MNLGGREGLPNVPRSERRGEQPWLDATSGVPLGYCCLLTIPFLYKRGHYALLPGVCLFGGLSIVLARRVEAERGAADDFVKYAKYVKQLRHDEGIDSPPTAASHRGK